MRRVLLALFLVLSTNQSFEEEERKVMVLRVDGVISPITVRAVEQALSQSEGAECLIVQLDTPGGLEGSMRKIVKLILGSKIPVVVYVSPEGARAASAGTFITLSAHVACMAPTTCIGAAHPVALGMKMDEAMKEKVLNDTVSFIRSICKKRGRNEAWAEECVRKSRSITSDEALKLGVIDLIAEDLAQLLLKLHGREVQLKSGVQILQTKGAEIHFIKMNFIRQFLQTITNPNLAYIFLILGIYGLIYEFLSPGIGLAGVAGGIFLILAFFAFQSLPINTAGLLLIIFGITLLLLDLKVPSHGILTLGGITSFTLGSFMLMESDAPFLSISIELILTLTACTLAFFLFALSAALRAQRRKVVTGLEGIVGAVGYAKSDIEQEGLVYVEGEYWRAVNRGDSIRKGEKVKIVKFEGNKVWIEKIEE
jgi:membrane-bound serine protease (ClpP class)